MRIRATLRATRSCHKPIPQFSRGGTSGPEMSRRGAMLEEATACPEEPLPRAGPALRTLRVSTDDAYLQADNVIISPQVSGYISAVRSIRAWRIYGIVEATQAAVSILLAPLTSYFNTISQNTIEIWKIQTRGYCWMLASPAPPGPAAVSPRATTVAQPERRTPDPKFAAFFGMDRPRPCLAADLRLRAQDHILAAENTQPPARD